ncbi:nmat-2 [Symbiodinium sp. CCMP2592]|nr:nmat-2 [Symbiodinium sp. CCMP2592]
MGGFLSLSSLRALSRRQPCFTCACSKRHAMLSSVPLQASSLWLEVTCRRSMTPMAKLGPQVTLAPSHHRLKMVEAAVSDSDWLMADGWECTCQSTWTPTVDVISHFAAELAKVKVSVGNSRPLAGNIRLVMLCGGDVLESFNATKENGDRVWPDEELEVILGQHGVVVVGRDDQDLDAFVQQCPLLARYADNITIAQPRIRTGISSSAVRAHLAAGESIRYLVHDKVWRYIFRHRLNELPNWQ